jgi:hypothetical protein
VYRYMLRELIRAQILAGELPSRHEHQIFGGKGDGSRCSCCGQSINRGQVLYEVTVPTAYGAPAAFTMHMPCYNIWQAECSPPMAVCC